jgi:hypothetical protein
VHAGAARDETLVRCRGCGQPLVRVEAPFVDVYEVARPLRALSGVVELGSPLLWVQVLWGIAVIAG